MNPISTEPSSRSQPIHESPSHQPLSDPNIIPPASSIIPVDDSLLHRSGQKRSERTYEVPHDEFYHSGIQNLEFTNIMAHQLESSQQTQQQNQTPEGNLSLMPRLSPHEQEILRDEQGSPKTFHLAIGISIVLCGIGCFPFSCLPFWIVYRMFRNSESRRAQQLSERSKHLFHALLYCNVCLVCWIVLIVSILPPILSQVVLTRASKPS
ncbi:hypothetical protein C9374_010086 [Naegleria lovaniensis]|uniref:Transmembrane protein n=1 Tax=Naegleria lovaniensis TaxID=51637 RepID=A0AA88KJP1_NAELO|nr:uncharacterized protein C9374_010086 [Naegleria lovaniensis]KAG2375082.1 hypothetical protein C9374_010086 [Naegleria lovaniensis]